MADETLIVQLEGFEGPLDLLLELARAQKVDLAKISILALVDQYLAVIEGALRVRLELAADWLVMAAWLTWAKSRLLLPAPEEEEAPAEMLAGRLAALQAMRAAAAWLGTRPLLGWDVLARGAEEDFQEIDRSRLRCEMPALLGAYLAARRRAGGRARYRPKPMTYLTVKEAMGRLRQLFGSLPDWSTLEAFLPPELRGLERRAALSATLVAGLELAREGGASLRQDHDFGPIRVKGRA